MDQITKTYRCNNTPECKKAKSKMRYIRNVWYNHKWCELFMCGRCFAEKIVE